MKHTVILQHGERRHPAVLIVWAGDAGARGEPQALPPAGELAIELATPDARRELVIVVDMPEAPDVRAVTPVPLIVRHPGAHAAKRLLRVQLGTDAAPIVRYASIEYPAAFDLVGPDALPVYLDLLSQEESAKVGKLWVADPALEVQR